MPDDDEKHDEPAQHSDDKSDEQSDETSGKESDQKQGGKEKKEEKKDERTPDEKTREREAKGKKKPLWPWILAGLIVVGFAIAVVLIMVLPNPDPWTDDARVTAHYVTVAPRVSGQVTGVAVDDYGTVHPGELLVQLDPRDYQTALETAQATLARDRAQFAYATANVSRQPSLISEEQAAIETDEARLLLAQQNAQRYRDLARTGAGTQQERQQSDASLREAQASLASAEASKEAAERQLAVLQAQRDAAEATIRGDLATVRQAELNLSYTHVLASVDGTVAERSVQVGNYVSPGQTVMAVVPLDQVYIEANYLETALTHVLPGQHVRIHVDAYNIWLDGFVQSIGPATGATFAPVAPENATGNFTKIVQRLPVRILVSPGQPLARLLRVGLSVETTIHTGLANVVGMQGSDAARVTAPEQPSP